MCSRVSGWHNICILKNKNSRVKFLMCLIHKYILKEQSANFSALSLPYVSGRIIEHHSFCVSHADSVSRVNPVTYTLFKHTSSDGLSRLSRATFPDVRVCVWNTKNFQNQSTHKWVTADTPRAWSTLVLMFSRYCSRIRTLASKVDAPCFATTRPVGFVYFFLLRKSRSGSIRLHCGKLCVCPALRLGVH